jgi:hypothetical protein
MKHQLTTILLGEVSKSFRGKIFETQAVKSAPHYFEASVPRQVTLGQEKAEIANHNVLIELRGFPPDILVIQARVEVPSVFDSEIVNLEENVIQYCYEILKKRGGNEEFSENYSIFSVTDYEGEPEQFLKHSNLIATLLKSEKLQLDQKEIDYTLSSQIKYAHNDLTIIDWDGAFIFDPEGDIEATVELLTIANLQLLRHRLLDRDLDQSIEKMKKMVRMPTRSFFFFKNKEIAQDLAEIIKLRMSSITEFQTMERDIKLIGDWYSARLYELATKKFKIFEWKAAIKEKLESVEDIYSIVVENFTLSTKDRAEFVQIIAFFILQIGWFLLIILELFYFTR